MFFSKLIVAAAAFAVAQAVEFTNPAFNSITAGVAFNLTWTGADGPVTLLLKNGPPLALVTVSTIASGLTGTTYIWSVPATLAADTYAIEIDDASGKPNYSPQFQLIGGVTSTSSTGASTSSSAAAASSTGLSSSSFGNTTTTATGSSSARSTSASRTSGSAGSSSTGSRTSSATGASSSTSAPSSGSASGLASPLAFIFLALGAILTLN